MSKIVRIGNLEVGGKNPVRIKGMLKSPLADTKKVIGEAKRLEIEGVEAIRIAVKEEKDVKIAAILKKHISLPLAADVHFHPFLALRCIKEGFDQIRLNPLNIAKRSEVRKIAQEAKRNNVSIRVGVNSGGFKKQFSSPQSLARQMVKKTEDYLKVLEGEGFSDIMVSLKGSDVLSTVIANRIFSQRFDYPLHLGITASGPFLQGVIKSSLGLGMLLSEGIGNIIRVSLTASSFWEVRAAKYILQFLNLRKFGPEIISCPTCSRCEVNLINVVGRFERELEKTNFNKPLRIALMGCIVNGPGEAKQADIGAAFGKRKAVIFRKDKILGYSNEKNIVNDLLREVR